MKLFFHKNPDGLFEVMRQHLDSIISGRNHASAAVLAILLFFYGFL